MTKLEEEIQSAISTSSLAVFMGKKFNSEDYAKAAAQVALKYIEKAYEAGEEHEMVEDETGVHLRTIEQWKIETGLIDKVK